MIALLRGALIPGTTTRAIIDVQGVGYAVSATNRDLNHWKGLEGEVTAHISTQVREDSIQLYGFSDAQHRQSFEIMLGVSGVGPKVALSALDAMELSQLRQAIETDDLRALTSISGVGKKTAQRIALELKGKLPVEFSTDRARVAVPISLSNKPDPLELALQRLGYTKTEIERTRARLIEAGIPEETPVAQRLKAALSTLYQDIRK